MSEKNKQTKKNQPAADLRESHWKRSNFNFQHWSCSSKFKTTRISPWLVLLVWISKINNKLSGSTAQSQSSAVARTSTDNTQRGGRVTPPPRESVFALATDNTRTAPTFQLHVEKSIIHQTNVEMVALCFTALRLRTVWRNLIYKEHFNFPTIRSQGF